MPLPLIFILVTVALDAIGIGLVIPVMPDLLREIGGGTLAEAAVWGGILSTSYAAMQFLFGPAMGALSDRVGRRPVLLVTLAVLALDYVVMALAGVLWLLLAGRIVGGITAATQATAAAVIADISKPSEKAARFGLVGAAFGMGFVIGPALGGLLAEFGTRAPFWAAAALAAANLVFGWLVLPETAARRAPRPFSFARANPFGAFAALRVHGALTRYVLLFFLYQVAFMVYPSIWAYFTLARFGWSPGMIGASLAAFGIALAIVQGGLIRLVIAALGQRGTVVYGLVFNAFAFLAIAFVADGRFALALIPLLALGAVVTPALQGLMSDAAPEDAQGALQGVLASAMGLALIVSPLVMTGTFALFTEGQLGVTLPGAPFLVSMALMGACLAVFLASPKALRA